MTTRYTPPHTRLQRVTLPRLDSEQMMTVGTLLLIVVALAAMALTGWFA